MKEDIEILYYVLWNYYTIYYLDDNSMTLEELFRSILEYYQKDIILDPYNKDLYIKKEGGGGILIHKERERKKEKKKRTYKKKKKNRKREKTYKK